MTAIARTPDDMQEDFSTREVAQRLGMAVRSVQLMVDRGELQAWRTPGGHRRILRASLDAWLTGRGLAPTKPAELAPADGAPQRLKALLIEDSVHYQNLVMLLAQQEFPDLDLHTANDGIGGLVDEAERACHLVRVGDRIGKAIKLARIGPGRELFEPLPKARMQAIDHREAPEGREIASKARLVGAADYRADVG